MERVTTIVLRSELGSNIPKLSIDRLATLIRDIHDNPNENPRHTVIRHLAGEIRGDLCDRFGEPRDSKLTVTASCEYWLAFYYPTSIWTKGDVNAFLAQRAEHWIRHFVAVLIERAAAEGDTQTVELLRTYDL